MSNTFLKALFLFAVSAGALAFAQKSALADDQNAQDVIQLSTAEQIQLSGDEMEGKRGAFGLNEMTSEQTLSAATSGNSLNVGGNLTNGNISIGDNLGGFGSYVMNTGNNSTINSAVSLNIQIMQSP